MKPTNFSPALLEELRAKIEAVGNEYGIDLKVGRIKYRDDFFRCTLQAALNVSPEVAEEKASVDKVLWEQNRIKWNMPSDYFGTEFFINSGKLNGYYKVVGCKPRSRKYPIIVEGANGRFKVPAWMIHEAAKRPRSL